MVHLIKRVGLNHPDDSTIAQVCQHVYTHKTAGLDSKPGVPLIVLREAVGPDDGVVDQVRVRVGITTPTGLTNSRVVTTTS